MARQKVADTSRAERSSLRAGAGNLIRELLKALVDPYRPELHYMRGPGPKWHAKQDRARATVPAMVRGKALIPGGRMLPR
jgi:hypothetical protein